MKKYTKSRLESNLRPPRWADKLLEWFVAPHLLEYVQGDLHENFYKRVVKVGASHASREYVWAILHCLTPFFTKRNKKSRQNMLVRSFNNNEYPKPLFTNMLSNYLTIAFRNLWRHKAFTAINIVGLALGMATCLLILIFVRYELSYDRFNTKANRIFRMTMHEHSGSKETNMAYSAAPSGPAMKRDYPGVEAFTRLETQGTFVVKSGNQQFKENRVVFTDSSFFEMFSIPLLKGLGAGSNSNKMLDEPNTVVLTESTARKYFGNQDPIGKSLRMGEMGLFRVTGVCQDVPSNSHFHFDFFGSYCSLPLREKWMASGASTYLLISKGYPIQKLAIQSPEIVRKYLGPEVPEFFGMSYDEFLRKGNHFKFQFQPLSEIHLGPTWEGELEPNSDVKYVYVFSAIALFILLIASINFMNLSTAASAGRAKEVGVRKVLGSLQAQLIGQFLSESVLITFVALIFACGMVVLALPVFNQLAGKQFPVTILLNVNVICYTVLGCFVVGLISGSYPAFFLASFQPVGILKGSPQVGMRSGWLRNTLVTFQFVVSIGMIICTLVVYQQLRFIENKNVGFDKEQVLVLHDSSVLGNRLNSFEKELANQAQIVSISGAGYLPAGNSHIGADGFRDVNASQERTPYLLKTYRIDGQYLTTLGIRLASGRNFSKTFSDHHEAVIVNEAAVRQFGWKDPIGQRITNVGDGSQISRRVYTVIGVTKDFHFESMHQRIAPLIMLYGDDSYQLALRINTGDVPGLLHRLGQLWKSETDAPFSYSFLSERFNAIYRSEQRIGELIGLFAGLAVAIACLGLFGLAAFTTHQRTKEIGVRKVLGGSVASIVSLLLRGYLKIIMLALVIASPIAGYLMSQWLGGFAYKTDLTWWVFPVSGVLAISVAILTVSFQAIKAALKNPVTSLRSE